MFLSKDQCRSCSRRIPRCALVHMDYSFFRALYNSRNDQSFITFTGPDYKSFQYLLTKFHPLDNGYSPYVENGKVVCVMHQGGTHGPPRSLDAASCLGLVLGYTITRSVLLTLQMLFGVSYSVMALFLKFSIRLLLLQEEERTKFQLPSVEKIAEF
jgi:hypothetical protein